MKRPGVSVLILAALVLGGCGPVVETAGSIPVAGEAVTSLPPVPTTAAPPATTQAPPTTAPPTTAAPTTTPTTLPPPTTAAPTTTSTTTLPPVFAWSIEPVTADVVWATWRDDCPLHFDELSLLTLSYWNFEGEVATGQMTINSAVAGDVVTAFEELFAVRFPIERIALVDDYGGDDKAAMAANVTSGFNCRFVDGTERWSNHAFGLAVDINPLLNPWARPSDVLPVEGEPYVDREQSLPGMINTGDVPITIFEQVGWSWGGVWQSADYMHFSKPGN
jgi:hypothetical protein